MLLIGLLLLYRE